MGYCDISTHTPLARRDQKKIEKTQREINFYSHASCEARPPWRVCLAYRWHFYSHASCEARRLCANISVIPLLFLLTRLLRGATFCFFCSAATVRFLLTRPMRGATRSKHQRDTMLMISTHTPHAGRDARSIQSRASSRRFLLTRPMRGATGTGRGIRETGEFLLTRPMRGATCDISSSS